MDVPQKAEHTIVRYRMQRENVHGYAKINSRYDLMELVMVYLGREETAEKGTQLHTLLSTVLSNKLKLAEKKSILEKKYDIVTSVELEGGFVSMCNLSEVIWERSIKEGLQQGMLQTLVSLVQKGMITMEAAAQEANMELEAFEQYMEHVKEKE